MNDSADEAVTVPSIITLVQGIERVGPGSPAAIAYKSALRRKGTEAFGADGRAAVERLLWEIAAADTARAESRMAILREVWGHLPGWRP